MRMLLIGGALGVLAISGVAVLLTAGEGSSGDSSAAQRVRRVGLMHVGTDHVPPSLDTLYDELRGLQYGEGRNIHLDWRNLPDERAAHEVAQEFVKNRVHAIVAFENQTVRASMTATSEIPIVLIHVDDPVANGFVQSHARPGGNVTGFEGGGLGNLTEKRLDLF